MKQKQLHEPPAGAQLTQERERLRQGVQEDGKEARLRYGMYYKQKKCVLRTKMYYTFFFNRSILTLMLTLWIIIVF